MTRPSACSTTALAAGVELPVVESMMFAAVTDHVFVDGGHTLDFTNKAFEALGHVGTGSAAAVLPTLLPQTARASRSEEGGEWRHPSDLVSLIRRTNEELPAALAVGAACHGSFDDVAGLGVADRRTGRPRTRCRGGAGRHA